MANINTSLQNMEDLQDPSVLGKLYPNADKSEIHSMRDIVARIIALKDMAILSKKSSVKILAAIKYEWIEELERSSRKIKRNILEKIRAVYELEGLRGLQLRPMMVPVTIAAILVIFTYAPEIVLPFSLIAGKTVSSLSGVTTDSLLLIGGFVTVVAIGLLILIARASRK
jgi:hypothetical protein